MAISTILRLVTLGVVVMSVLLRRVPSRIYEDDFLANSKAILSSVVFDNQDTTVLITGANSGLGLATCQDLAKRAVNNPNFTATLTIIMACRSLEKCETAQAGVLKELLKLPAPKNFDRINLVPMQLDLEDRDSIEQFSVTLQPVLAKSFTAAAAATTPAADDEEESDTPKPQQLVPPLHVMIHNAGIYAPHKDLQFDPQHYNGVETHYHVNYLGHVLLTHFLWKNVMAVSQTNPNRKARLVTITEPGLAYMKQVDPMQHWYDNSLFARPFGSLAAPMINLVGNRKQYARSKQAQLFFAAALQDQYPTAVSVAASHPGWTRGTSLYQKVKNGIPAWLQSVLTNMPLLSQAPAQGALNTVLAALDSTAQYVGPMYLWWGTPVVTSRQESEDSLYSGSAHHKAFSKAATQQLWDHSLHILGIKTFGEQTYTTR